MRDRTLGAPRCSGSPDAESKARRTGWQRLILAAALLTACDKKKEEPPKPAEKIPETAETADAQLADVEPMPAGSLLADEVVLTFAVYALPSGKEDVETAARAIHAERYAYLQSFEELEARAKPGVRITVPPMAEFAAPDLETLSYFGRGLTDAEKQAVQSSPKVVVATFAVDIADAARVHRDALAMMGTIADRTGGLVWDEDTRELFSREAWKAREEAEIDDPKTIITHVVTHPYQEGELIRIVTLGMAKFGLPDIVVEDVPRTLIGHVGSIVDALAVTMAKDKTLARAGAMTIEPETIGEVSGRAEIQLAVAKPREGDPPNRLVQIVFPGPAATLHVRQQTLVATLLGREEEISNVQHDQELLAASEAAKKELAALQSRFAKGMPEREALSVKAPFKTVDGGNEWMWVEVTAWNGDTIEGILLNEPGAVPGLEAGAKVQVETASVFDYIHELADGTQAGGKTNEIVTRRMEGGH